MAAQWVVHLTTRTGLDGGLIDAYRQELAQRESSDEVALLVPTQEAAETARRLALEVGSGVSALLDARIMTFPQLAETVLVANHHGSRQITPLQRELLVGDVLAELAARGQLDYLQSTFDKPGTVSAVGALLDEIKRGGIASADFPALIAQGAPGHDANRPVAAIFSRYQDRLQSLELYDEPGLFWNALEVLQVQQRKPLEELKVLLVDGFEEFTTTQLQMLEAFAEYVERIEIRLWLDEQRPAMTPRSAATLAWLKSEVQAEMRTESTSALGADSNLGQLRARLFSSGEGEIGGVDGSVAIIEAAGGMVGECRELARRLKRLLSEPDSPEPNQVAIFLRSWDTGYDTALRQALDWYGVPADFAKGPALVSVPAVQAALDVLDVVVGGWLRQDVIKLLNSNYVKPLVESEPKLSARRLEKLALEAGIIGGAFDGGDGRQAWVRGLRQLQQRLEGDRRQRLQLERAQGLAPDDGEAQRVLEDDEGNRFSTLSTQERALAYVERAATLVDHLHGLLTPLEEPQSLAEAARAFGRVIETLGIVEAAGRGEAARVASDLQGLTQLSDLLRAIAETPDVLGTTGSGEAAQFAAHLRQACSAARLPGTRLQRSGVQVLDLAQAGLERFALVVVCGLRDGVFPARRRQDVFYSDAEREVLQGSLPGLRPRLGNQHDDEHLLYGALAAAGGGAWLSYPLTEANGSPVLRSLYVDEVLRHWQADGEGQAALVSRRRQSEVILPLSEAAQYLEALEAVQDQRRPAEEARMAAVAALTPPAGLPDLIHVQALARMEERRLEPEGGGAFAGVLEDEGMIAELVESYGPEHIYSVSQLNLYAGCPMRFFLSRVLGLEAPTEPTEGLDRRDLGTLVHRILANFFAARAIGRDGCEALTPETLPEAQSALSECIDEVCDSWSQTVFGADEVWARAVERLRADLRALLEFEASKSDPACPSLVRAVEATFGNSGSFALRSPAGEPIKLRGRMDRVDLMEQEGERRWALWDYKTSSGVAKRLVEQGIDLQLAVYAMAVEELFPGEAVGSGRWGYYRVARPVGWPSTIVRKADDNDSDNLEAAVEAAKAKIVAHVAAIRAGQFDLKPNEAVNPCRYCDFDGTCRIG